MARRENLAAHALQIGDVVALTENGPAIYERVPNRYAFREGAVVVKSSLSGAIEEWQPHFRIWRRTA